MAWRRPGDKPLSEPMMVSLLTHMCVTPSEWVNTTEIVEIYQLNDIFIHYNDVTMTSIGSQITSLTIVYSTVYSDADQRKHQSSTSLAFVWGIHRDRWIPRTKGQLRGKCFHLMTSSCVDLTYYSIASRWNMSHWRLLLGLLSWYLISNTLWPGQNGQHFPDDFFKCIFLNENVGFHWSLFLRFEWTILPHWFR